MQRRPDVLVIGGGVIGLTAAIKLAAEGLSVEVYDRGEFGREASWAGAGIIPPGNVERAATAYDLLRAKSSAAFPAFTTELTATTGIDTGYRACGGIEFLTAEETELPTRWKLEGLAVERLSPAGLSAAEPQIRMPNAEAYLLPGFAQVRNPWLVRALVARAEQLEVRLRPNVGVSLTKNELPAAGKYLLTAGAWSGRLLEELGVELPVRPLLGQIVMFRTQSPLIRRVLLADKRYLVPRDDGRLLAGSTEEPEAGFEKRTTASGIDELTAFARELVPRLTAATVETSWAGLRPASPDGMPFIGPVPGTTNMYAAVGHGRAGIQLSVATADLARDLILGRPTTDAFRLDRDTTSPVSPSFRS